MRKRIGLIIGEQDNEYAINLVTSIHKEAVKYDLDLFIFANYGLYDHNTILYGEGESSVYKIPNLDSFDGFILDETLYNIENMGEKVYNYFEKNARCPVVSLKRRTNRFYDILLGDRNAMTTVTRHFIKDHGFKKICHMTGRWELQDARERFRGYEDAMKEAGIDVTDDMVFYGNYWKTKATEAIDYFTRNGYPEVIVCANDFMAISIIDELQARGIRVPEDVCVSGYDNEAEGRCHTTPVTTLDANISEFGKVAMDTLYRAISGEVVPKEQFIDSTLILRDSCGCAKCTSMGSVEFHLSSMRRHYYGVDMSVFMYNGYQSAFEVDDIFTNADTYFKYNLSDKSYICLCSDALNSTHRAVELINEYSPNMILKRIFYSNPNKNYDSPEITFSRDDILPNDFFDTDQPQKYYINPIHSQNKCYGYMVSIYNEGDWPYHFTQSYTSALGNALDDYNIHNEYMNMDQIKSMYLTDSLTGINNRRGFEQNILIILDKAKRHRVYLSVASIDMDDLKYINDNFGHQAGDECLAALGHALASIIMPEESVARYGGDEFAAILMSTSPDRHKRFEQDLLNAIAVENEKLNAPYKIHASIGLVYIGSSPTGSMTQYMQTADQLMYEQKAAYKASKKM